MQLDKLISQIKSVDGTLKQEANKSVNRLLTIRNWLIGFYIVEYEQKGEDKAKYGDNLLDILASSLDIKGLSVTNLKLNRLFYIAFPQIRQTVSDELQNIDNQFVDFQTGISENIAVETEQTLSAQSYEMQLAEKVINKLSFSHITLLLPSTIYSNELSMQ